MIQRAAQASCKGNLAFFQVNEAPLTVLSDDMPAGTASPAHSHSRGQLVYASKGVLAVDVGGGQWLLPPSRALWITPRTGHAIRCMSDVSICTIYIDEAASATLPAHCCSVAVSGLFKEMVLRLAAPGTEPYRDNSSRARLMAMVLDEIRTLPSSPLYLPMPTDKRLLKVCAHLLREPACGDAIALLAGDAGLSSRHLMRLFQRETGMQFGLWRQQMRLIAALPYLAAGTPVMQAARSVGYRSAATFAALFKRTFGMSPSQYGT